MNEKVFELRTVGYVRADEERTWIELLPEYAGALAGLDGFSHIVLIWWSHRYDEVEYRSAVSAGKPYKQGPDEMGIFATRSPIRPNPIAYAPALISKIDAEKGIIETPYVDAEPGSPVLDIKPYSPSLDRVRDAKVPEWCSHWPNCYEENVGFEWEAEFNF